MEQPKENLTSIRDLLYLLGFHHVYKVLTKEFTNESEQCLVLENGRG